MATPQTLLSVSGVMTGLHMMRFWRRRSEEERCGGATAAAAAGAAAVGGDKGGLNKGQTASRSRRSASPSVAVKINKKKNLCG